MLSRHRLAHGATPPAENVAAARSTGSTGRRLSSRGTVLTLMLVAVAGLAVMAGGAMGRGQAGGAMGHSQAAGTPAGPSLVQTVKRVALRLEVAPVAFGLNRFLLALRDAQGHPVRNATVTVVLEMSDMPMGTTVLPARLTRDGRYQAFGRLTMPGHWKVSVVIAGRDLPAGNLRAAFRVTAAVQARVPVPAPLPLVGPPQGNGTAGTVVSPARVRWTGLPYRAIVSFLDNGLVYLPGHRTMVRVGALNHTITAAPDGTIWVTDYTGNRVAVIDPRSGRLVGSVMVGIAPVHIAFSRDRRRAYVTNFLSNDVSVVDVRRRRLLATVPVELHPHGLAITPDGRQVWVPCSGGGGIWVIDTRTNRVTSIVFTGGFPHAVAFSPNGRTAYMTDAVPGSLVVIDRVRGRVRARVSIGTGSAMVAVSPDGRRVYVTGQDGNALTVVDATTYQRGARIVVGGAPHGLALTPDGRLIYVATNTRRRVTVVMAATNRVVAAVAMPGAANELVLWR